MYKLAKEYYNQMGTLVSIENKELRNWIQVQRQAYNGKGTYIQLSKEKIEKLEQIGMVWNVNESNYTKMYEFAKEYYEEHGNLLLPHQYMINGKDLSSWIKEKRKSYKKGTLSEEQIEQLEAIGMIWDVRQYQWENMYQQAQEYYNEHGNLSITPKVNKKLYQWLKIQRKLYMEDGKLTEQQKELLSIIEIDQEAKKDIDIKPKVKIKQSPSRSDIWECMYEQAQEYFEQHGNLLVPRIEEYKQLSSWIKTQRRKYKTNNEKSNLSKEQMAELISRQRISRQ